MTLDENAALDQILHCLAHGNARDIGHGGDVALRRQCVARADRATIDGILDAAAKLQVKWRTALRSLFQRSKDGVAGVAHRAASTGAANMRTAMRTAPPSASSSGVFNKARWRSERRGA